MAWLYWTWGVVALGWVFFAGWRQVGDDDRSDTVVFRVVAVAVLWPLFVLFIVGVALRELTRR